MAKYLMEISIVDHRFLPCPPSLIAAAGSWLARKILGKGAWVSFVSRLTPFRLFLTSLLPQDANLVHYSGYTESELKPCAQLMLDYVVRNSSLVQAPKRGDDPLGPTPAASETECGNFIKSKPISPVLRLR